MFSLSGKNAVVTGGCSGIGLAIVARFVAAGANVIAADLRTTTEFGATGASFIEVDVTDESRIAAAFAEAELLLGKLDIVVNNAGIALDTGLIADTDLELYQKTLDVNLKGVFLGIKYGPRHMNDGGSIINTASLAASAAVPEYATYSASKAGVVSITASAAVELASRRIRVNAVCPGTTTTPMEPADSEESRLCAVTTCVGRPGTVEEQAAVYHFLAADDSCYINAQAINVDGGWINGLTSAAVEKLL